MSHRKEAKHFLVRVEADVVGESGRTHINSLSRRDAVICVELAFRVVWWLIAGRALAMRRTPPKRPRVSLLSTEVEVSSPVSRALQRLGQEARAAEPAAESGEQPLFLLGGTTAETRLVECVLERRPSMRNRSPYVADIRLPCGREALCHVQKNPSARERMCVCVFAGRENARREISRETLQRVDARPLSRRGSVRDDAQKLNSTLYRCRVSSSAASAGRVRRSWSSRRSTERRRWSGPRR